MSAGQINLGEKCTVALIIFAVAALSVNYGLIAGKVLSFTIGPVSIAEVDVKRTLLLAASLGLLGGLLICHLRSHWSWVLEKYTEGYRESSEITELVRSEVARAAEDTNYGAPVGNLTAGLVRRRQSIGRFTARLGNLSDEVMIEPTRCQHVSAVRAGVARVLGRGLWLSVHLPFALGVWAIIAIVL